MLRMEIELFSKLLELFCIFCLCFFDLCLPCFLVFLQLKSSLILFRSENYLILIRLQHMRPAIARARLHTPETSCICYKTHALHNYKTVSDVGITYVSIQVFLSYYCKNVSARRSSHQMCLFTEAATRCVR